jgi:hypothetical protein
MAIDRQSEAIFICTIMQAVLAYRWLIYSFSVNFCVRVSHHHFHVMILRLLSESFVGACLLMREYVKNLPFIGDWCKVYNHVVKL